MRSLMLGLLALGCGDRIIAIDRPPLDGSRSAIFALHAPDTFSARAVDLEEDPAVGFDVDLAPQAEGRIEVLGFDESLDELGLSAGVIEGAEEGVPLRAQDQLFEASFRGTETSAWTMITERSDEIDGLRFPAAGKCTTLEILDHFELPSSVDHTFSVPLAGERVWVAYEDGSSYVVDRNGAAPVTDRPSRLPIDALVRLEDGTFVIGGENGAVWTARVRTSTSGSPIRIEGELLTAIPSGEWIVHLDGGFEDGSYELFALGKTGKFHRYDGATWTLLHDFAILVNTASSVVRVRRGLAYAGADESNEVIRYRDGAVEPFAPQDLSNGVPGMAYLTSFGLLMARSEGGIYRLVDEQWRFLEGSPISLNAYSFLELEESFLFGAAFGFLSEYREGVGYCPEVQVGAGAIRAFTSLGEDYLLSEDKPISRNFVQVTIVRRLD